MTEKDVNPADEMIRREAFEDLLAAPLKTAEQIAKRLEEYNTGVRRSSLSILKKLDDPNVSLDEIRSLFSDYNEGFKRFSDEIEDYSDYLKQVRKQLAKW